MNVWEAGTSINMFQSFSKLLTSVSWHAPWWVQVATGIVATLAVLLVLVTYMRTRGAAGLRVSAGILKTVAIVALAICLMDPHLSCIRPQPGANLFVIVADNSQSLQVRDEGARQSRSDLLKDDLTRESPWQTRLGQDFDVRRYVFDTRMRPVSDFEELSGDGPGSSLATSLATLAERYADRPNAGMLLFTDGNATDFKDEAIAWDKLPPVYPVVLGTKPPTKDVSVIRVSTSQTNFEAAPVTVTAEIQTHGYTASPIVVQLLDDEDKEVQQKTLAEVEDGKAQVVRFQFRPDRGGINFYRVRAFAEDAQWQFEKPDKSPEATLVNNSRLVMVDRGEGPYRVLYVTGRPNWEFKFLRRALLEDTDVELVGLVRIANREPKFTFRGRAGERTNPLFRGFGNEGDEEAEKYDQPVLLRLGIEEEDELRDGFPQAADQLFRYHAIILDDLESGFFTQDQMALVQDFVSQRGGGFLMLGGQESFTKGKYRRTPIGEMLPIYLDSGEEGQGENFQLELTREGWLQPWVRLRATEQGEEKRLEEMPAFKTLNQVRQIKPGASVLAHVQSAKGKTFPALVAQRFGNGRTAALLVGDLWRWNLHRPDAAEASDLEKSWRQTVRWLISDVPQRIEINTSRKDDQAGRPIELAIRVFEPDFQPLDNASVSVTVTTPEGKEIEVTAAPHDRKSGVYSVDFVPRTPGAYRAQVKVIADDGSEVGQREIGWTSEPAGEEFQTLRPNRALLERIAAETGGEVIDAGGLNGFVRGLPNRKVPVTEAWIFPLWHHWGIFVFAIGMLVGEWGLRRWKGLP